MPDKLSCIYEHAKITNNSSKSQNALHLQTPKIFLFIVVGSITQCREKAKEHGALNKWGGLL
jgi:hypothetical protein